MGWSYSVQAAIYLVISLLGSYGGVRLVRAAARRGRR